MNWVSEPLKNTTPGHRPGVVFLEYCPLILVRAASCQQFFHPLIQTEARRLLSRRILLECYMEFP